MRNAMESWGNSKAGFSEARLHDSFKQVHLRYCGRFSC